MTKSLMPHWKLAALVCAAAERRAPGRIVFATIMPGDAIVQDDECEALSRTSWDAKFIFALRQPRETPAELDAEIARLKDCYDLAVMAN
jgi:hypothetical protein